MDKQEGDIRGDGRGNITAGGWLEEKAAPPGRTSVGPVYSIDHGHWFQEKSIQFLIVPAGSQRRPRTTLEWARCAWNADIFFGHVPILKTLAALSLATSAAITLAVRR